MKAKAGKEKERMDLPCERTNIQIIRSGSSLRRFELVESRCTFIDGKGLLIRSLLGFRARRRRDSRLSLFEFFAFSVGSGQLRSFPFGNDFEFEDPLERRVGACAYQKLDCGTKTVRCGSWHFPSGNFPVELPVVAGQAYVPKKL